jgi:hypothetical protein
MKLYRLGRINHIYPPEEVERINARHATLNDTFAERAENDIQENEQVEYKEWKKLGDQLSDILLGTVFVDNPRRLAPVAAGQREHITVVTTPDSFPVLQYLDILSSTSDAPMYRIPMNDLWEHLGRARDWTLNFAELTRPIGEVGARVSEHARELPFDKSIPGYITLYSPQQIKRFYGPNEAKDAKERLNTLKRVRARYRNEEVMRRRDRTAHEALELLSTYADGAPVYLSKQEAFDAAQEGSKITRIQIPLSAEEKLTDIFFQQWRRDAYHLPWELLWEHDVNRRANDPEKWTHKDIPIEREPTEIDAGVREMRKK